MRALCLMRRVLWCNRFLFITACVCVYVVRTDGLPRGALPPGCTGPINRKALPEYVNHQSKILLALVSNNDKGASEIRASSSPRAQHLARCWRRAGSATFCAHHRGSKKGAMIARTYDTRSTKTRRARLARTRKQRKLRWLSGKLADSLDCQVRRQEPYQHRPRSGTSLASGASQIKQAVDNAKAESQKQPRRSCRC
jgi:hypothetical protein